MMAKIPAISQNEFQQHLDRTSRIVRRWPNWKQELLGGKADPPLPTRVVNCNREPCDVLVDRTTIYGNPFIIGRDGNRKQVIAKFKQHVRSQPALVARIKSELKGLVLGCHCKPKSCHADIIAEIADEDDSDIFTL